ncbi:MAG: hypothetical protein ABSD12_09140, partial [Paraburkholderia sp.]
CGPRAKPAHVPATRDAEPQTKRQKKMGETPIILLPVVASEPHMKSRTPSDSAIVAIFRDKRKLAARVKHAFLLDFTAIFYADEGEKRFPQLSAVTQGVRSELEPSPMRHGFFLCMRERVLKTAG